MAEFTPNDQLRSARKEKHLSREQLGALVGTNSITVARWERGEKLPDAVARTKLCEIFQQQATELGLTHIAAEKAPIFKTTAPTALYDPAIPLLPSLSLIGREAEITVIKAKLLTTGSEALTALNGLPGVGKTALAITLAHDQELRAHFKDGVLWAALGPQANILAVLSHWGRLLTISEREMEQLGSSEAWARAIHNAIGTRQMLLILDDAWQVDDALLLKVGGPACMHLLTTRFPAIAAQLVIGGGTTLRELSSEQGMDLLSQLAPQAVTVNKQKVQDLVEAVGGLPLALTLIGNYLRKHAYTGQTRRISNALDLLTDASTRLQLSQSFGPLESHPSLPNESSLSLGSIIAVTDQTLDPQVRSVLYALSVFPPKPNSFSETAALHIAQCEVEELDVLMDTGLLEYNSTERYLLHQSIADYARLNLVEPALSQANKRLIEYAIDYIQQHKKDYELLELESTVLLAALEVAYKAEMRPELMQAVIAFVPFMLLRAWYDQAALHIQRAREAALALSDQHSLTYILAFQGQLAQKQGRYEESERYYQEGLELARQSTDKEQICTLLDRLGNMTWRRGKFQQAEVYLQEGLRLAYEIDDRERIGSILKTLAAVVDNQGNSEQSNRYLLQGLELAREIGEREQLCNVLLNLGANRAGHGHFSEAEIYFQEALELARQIGHREVICIVLNNLGDVAVEEQDYARADAYLQEGLALARQIEHREWIATLLVNLGFMNRKHGDYIGAAIYIQEALQTARQTNRPFVVCTALYEAGKIYLDQNDVQAAERAFRELLATAPKGSQDLIALAQYGLAAAAAVQGRIEEARQLGQSSLSTLEAMGHRDVPEVRQWLEAINCST
jgi:tetratricopeptide (TPR) repeat protein/transcriptional regulator with XRE-family HTH domain